MNERVYQRIMEAGARSLERERRQAVEADLERLPERDARALTVSEIAREYFREAPTAGIEQLRFMDRELREMARTQAVVERDLAIEDRKGLGLRFHAAQDLEKAHDAQLRQRDDHRQSAVDRITFVLTERERELIDRGTEQAARELQAQLDSNRINLEQAREQFLGLAYAMGRNQELERRTERDAAARSLEPAEKVVEQLHEREAIRLEKDQPVSRQLGAIGAVVEHETGRRRRAELADLAIEVNRERLIAGGMDPEKARWETIVIPAPALEDSDRGKDPRALVREIEQRTRENALAREQAMNAQIAALVERGVPADTAQGVVTVRQASQGKDHRSAQQREVEQAEAQLKARGIAPEIARVAAEGRWHEPPAVQRANEAADALVRQQELDRRYGRER
ncbi:hypothetical protein [Nocardia sp. NPDC024068]|uniref:hypothetical protein n=1 Tax=Nocardia sp. NPDC024068 TaxID=3157197 RepID=UPI0033C19D72